MEIQEHYENFMSQPDVEQYIKLYCSILENRSNNWKILYYGLLNEVTKDRALLVTSNEQVKEYGQIRDLVESAIDEHTKKCFITVLFDALMVEKIKTYSVGFDAALILKEELHKIYLIENYSD